MTGRWFRDIYRDAVWESPSLKAAEKAVAETYARHARDADGNKSAGADLAWLTYERLMEKAGIGRRAGVSGAVARLVELGWLKPERQVSRRATVYRLAIPVGGSSTVGTTGEQAEAEESRSSTVGTTVVPLADHGSSTSASGSSDGGTQPLGPLEELTITPTSPYPSVEPASAVVVEAEIVEEEGSTSSTEDQLQGLIDEAVAAKPHWRSRRHEIRAQYDALMMMFDGDAALAERVVRETALAADSGSPSRMTVALNPALVRANAVHQFARAEAMPEPLLTGQLHPQAHAFEAKPDSLRECQHCLLPEANARHRVPKPRNVRHEVFRQAPDAEYDDLTPFTGRRSPPRRPGYTAWQNPTDPDAYRGEL